VKEKKGESMFALVFALSFLFNTPQVRAEGFFSDLFFVISKGSYAIVQSLGICEPEQDLDKGDKILFPITQDRAFTIHVSYPLEDIFRYDWIEIEYSGPEGKIKVGRDELICALEELSGGLENLLAGKQKLHPSITKDIGYYWSEYLDQHRESRIVKCPEAFEYVSHGNEKPWWVGHRFLMWSAHGTATWMYEKEDTFFIEITPTCEWKYDPDAPDTDPTPEENARDCAFYQDFIENYKPLAIVELDKKVAREWLEQTKNLLELVKSNDKKYFCTKPICLKCVFGF
jgi:hypothetical protein